VYGKRVITHVLKSVTAQDVPYKDINALIMPGNNGKTVL
jgi:hypothetical protein